MAAAYSLEPEMPDFGSMTKAQLLAYAAENGIDGISSGMTKTEIISVLSAD